MYGGSADIFENPAAEMPPPPLPEEEASTSDDANSSEESSNDSIDDESILDSDVSPDVPPVPEEGLPEGWTMEQWAYYGAKWLEQNKEE